MDVGPLPAARQSSQQWSLAELAYSYPARLTCYATITFALFQGVFYGLTTIGSDFVAAENGPVESAQVYLAIFASLCLFYTAFRCRRGRAGLVVCAAMVGYAAAREADSIFESMFFDDAYKWFVGLPMLVIAVSALWINRKRVVPDALWLVRQPSVTMFAIGGIYLCAVCQLFDRPAMWSELTSGATADATKATVEEFAELFAYLLLGFSGIEGLAMAHDLDEVAEAVNEEEPATVVDQPRLAA